MYRPSAVERSLSSRRVHIHTCTDRGPWERLTRTTNSPAPVMTVGAGHARWASTKEATMRPRPALAVQRSSPPRPHVAVADHWREPAGRCTGPRPAAAGDHLITNISLDGDLAQHHPRRPERQPRLQLQHHRHRWGAHLRQALQRWRAHPQLRSPRFAALPAVGQRHRQRLLHHHQRPGCRDQIRLQMYNADQSVLLFETFIPVYYLSATPPTSSPPSTSPRHTRRAPSART